MHFASCDSLCESTDKARAGGIQMFRQKKKGPRNKPDKVIFAIFAIFVIFNVIFQRYKK